MDPNNLTLKDVVISVSPTLCLVAGIALMSGGYIVAGVVVLVPTAAIFIYSFVNLPFQEIEKKITERNEKWRSSRIGRIKLITSRLFDYLSIFLSVFVISYMIWSYIFES
jgi:hypothetical protein